VNEAAQVDAARVLAIIQEEAPQVFQLAVRRAMIESQQELIEQMKAALGAPLDEPVRSPDAGPQ
jgi:hypothetical protein